MLCLEGVAILLVSLQIQVAAPWPVSRIHADHGLDSAVFKPYKQIKNYANRAPCGAFVLTTTVDGLWLKIGWLPSALLELHGKKGAASLGLNQSSRPDPCFSWWLSDGDPPEKVLPTNVLQDFTGYL
eukprot:s1924_g5.t1